MCIYVSILQVFPLFSYTLEIQISQMFLMTLEELLSMTSNSENKVKVKVFGKPQQRFGNTAYVYWQCL